MSRKCLFVNANWTLAVLLCLGAGTRVEAQTNFSNWLSPIVPAGQCRSGEEYQVTNLPVKRDQGALGFCYGFSLTGALDHLKCTAESLACSDPKNSLSVIDVISTGNEGRLKEGGISLNIAHSVLSQRELALESCAPYVAIQKQGWNTLKQNEATLQQLKKAYDQRAQPQRACETILSILNQVATLQKSMAEVEYAITKSTFEEFLATLSLPEQCKSQRVKVPSFDLMGFKEPEPGQDPQRFLRKAIVDVIKDNRPVIFDFCMQTDCKDGAGHSVLIHGARLNCCSNPNQVCQFEYHVRDSARVIANEPGDYWVNASFVEEKGFEYSKTRPLFNPDGSQLRGLSAFLSLKAKAEK